MKTLITATMLLALVVPAQASKFRQSDRKWLPVMDAYQYWAGKCHAATSADEDRASTVCAAAKMFAKKLDAAGYCLYARDGVGRPSKDREHCYEIDFPER